MLRRPPPKREPKAVFTVLTEGKNTEPEYFRELQKTLDSSIIKIEIIAEAGVPKTIVQRAKELNRLLKKSETRSNGTNQSRFWRSLVELMELFRDAYQAAR